MSQTTFQDYALSANILKSLSDMNFTEPTDIQKKTFEALLGSSGDLLALAETGSGKTAAYTIPLLEQIKTEDKHIQGLILCPTRELAIQVSEQVQKLGRAQKVNVATIYGGASYLIQERDLKRGAHVLIATPGRLIDFIEKGKISLKKLNVIVLDEADEMISMGFKEDLETILDEAHENSQRWLFSATMSKSIEQISKKYLEEPKKITVHSSGKLPDSIEHTYFAIQPSRKRQALLQILTAMEDFYGIIFCQTKIETEALQSALQKSGFMAESFHGDRTQKEREKILTRFRKREVSILVSTDVAARGLDVKDLTHVVNYSLPWDVESYIHRVGRTGRNGQKGIALSLITPSEKRALENIQRRTKTTFKLQKMMSLEDVVKTKVSAAIQNVITSFTEGTKSNSFNKAQAVVKSLLDDCKESFDTISKEQLMTQIIYNSLKNILTQNDKDYGLNEADIKVGEGRDDRPDRDRRSGGFRGGGFRGREDRGGFRGGFRGGRGRDRDDRGSENARDDRGESRGSYFSDKFGGKRENKEFGRDEERSEGRPPRRQFRRDAAPASDDGRGGSSAPRRKKY